MPGFPALYKEIAEIIECGQLEDFKGYDYVKSIYRFASIEQRFGIWDN